MGFLLTVAVIQGYGQVIVPIFPLVTIPEHGFLPGKKFRFYPTINKYDLGGIRLRVEMRDLRDSLKIERLDCSLVEINNKSEFAGDYGAQIVYQYFQYLLPAAGVTLDSTSTEVLTVSLEALDNRLLGFGNITAHGLCQICVQWKDFSKCYCVDITDKDSHSPISPNAFVTRKTGTRVIQSAAIREAIERLITDLQKVAQSPNSWKGQ
jgi:hypothetical protein